ncbi:hypothetical protein C1645_830413 [Glomus cerebriforme]|uniref:HAT C-terminal dimerisation domain-containing protein n=1 Tax=Glomus cerebriforme TaxID=658196 RepID=A0A397SP14_9GLOM|nr:hypothetical protein C1645_830413 [Glomus cerebriforme]
MDSFNQFRGNLVDFWNSTIGIGSELACVAIHIHGICVNSTSVERLWSSMSYLHTNQRNRLELIEEWIELGNRENQFKDSEDECFLSPEWNNDFGFAGQNVHPANDERAKWNLSTLFESFLESPSFLGLDEIFTNAY